MRVLIVARTRRGGGACVGGISEEGRSVRLIAADAATNERAGLEYQVGEVWELEWSADPNLFPPHIENIIVHRARRLRLSAELEKVILRFMPPESGGWETLFDGRLQASPSGSLYVTERTGLPGRSTMFWRPAQPLTLDCDGKRIRYRYPTEDGGRTVTFVGFQEPVEVLPAGTLLRVSLAHWWRPTDKPDQELRCYVQLSGWHGQVGASTPAPAPCPAPFATAALPEIEQPGEQAQTAPTRKAVVDHARVREVLKQTFGFDQFLPVQGDVVTHVLEHSDTLAVMPTGGGKSLCYQLPALLLDGLTVVVSPLIALMQDQVGQLCELKIPAAFLNSTVLHREYLSITNRVRRGEVKLLYVAPETLVRPETRLLLEQSRLSCLAVDEAHCISEWGHDFRPEYRQLQDVRGRFPHAVCLALTATATGRVREDIRRLLGIPAEGEFVASFNRRNLFLAAEPRHDGLAQTLAFLEKHRGHSGIIYCGTRKQVDELSAALKVNGWPALPYHAGLDDQVRSQNQERFIRDEAPIMVATVAFGLGINKANVRFIVHYNLPKDVESYYQEIGRAGRDGQPADCLLLYTRADALIHRHFIEQGADSQRQGRKARLNALMSYAEERGCRRVPLLGYFGEIYAAPCGYCDNCAPAPDSGAGTDVTVAAQKFLSCVKRTGEIYGAAHIIAVLRGSRAKKVLAARHEQLSTFGIGIELSSEAWQELAHQFVRQGLVDSDPEFGGLRLTPKGWRVLKGETVHASLRAVPATPATAIIRPVKRRRCHEVGELFRSGQTLDEIARHYGVQRKAVLQQFYHFYESGGQLDAAQLLACSSLSEPERRRVLETFDRLGLERLGPVHEALGGRVVYDELHLLRLYALCRQERSASRSP